MKPCNCFCILGQKKLKVDEFLPLYSACKKDKDIGNIEDFREVLKLYDKNENGQMYYDELKHILQSLGINSATKFSKQNKNHSIS